MLTSLALSDGTSREVAGMGNVKASQDIALTEVLHILVFKYNLMSVIKLTKEGKLKLEFTSTNCQMMDIKTN